MPAQIFLRLLNIDAINGAFPRIRPLFHRASVSLGFMVAPIPARFERCCALFASSKCANVRLEIVEDMLPSVKMLI
jgi:hypothetical protein